MVDSLAAYLIETINWHRTWIRAVDFEVYGGNITTSGYDFRQSSERKFRLEIRVALYGYRKGAILCISENQLDRSISQLSAKDRRFRLRVKNLSLTYSDINLIFESAMGGALSLELEA